MVRSVNASSRRSIRGRPARLFVCAALTVAALAAGCSGGADSGTCDDAMQALAGQVLEAALMVEEGTHETDRDFERHVSAGRREAERVRSLCPSDTPGMPELLYTLDHVSEGNRMPRTDPGLERSILGDPP